MLKSLFAVGAASALLLPSFVVPAHAARGGLGGAVGKDPRVCLLTFSSAADFGADAAVVKAQYLPLRIAIKHETDTSTMGIAYYGFGALPPAQQAQIDFYFPTGSSSPTVGVTQNSDTKTLCQAFMDYAQGQDDD